MARVEPGRLSTRYAELLDDGISVLSLDDPLVPRFGVFVPGDEQESVGVDAHPLVLLEAQHHVLVALHVGTLTDEWHALVRREAVAGRLRLSHSLEVRATDSFIASFNARSSSTVLISVLTRSRRSDRVALEPP